MLNLPLVLQIQDKKASSHRPINTFQSRAKPSDPVDKHRWKFHLPGERHHSSKIEWDEQNYNTLRNAHGCCCWWLKARRETNKTASAAFRKLEAKGVGSPWRKARRASGECLIIVLEEENFWHYNLHRSHHKHNLSQAVGGWLLLLMMMMRLSLGWWMTFQVGCII